MFPKILRFRKKFISFIPIFLFSPGVSNEIEKDCSADKPIRFSINQAQLQFRKESCLEEKETLLLISEEIKNSTNLPKKPNSFDLLLEKPPSKKHLSKDQILEKKYQLLAKEQQLIERKRQLLEKKAQLLERQKKALAQQKELKATEQEKKSKDNHKPFAEHQPLASDLAQKKALKTVELEKESKDPYSLDPVLAIEDAPSPYLNPINQNLQNPPPPVEKCTSPFQIMHVGLRHTESKGVGYKDGYTTIEGFGIYDRISSLMPFFDVRGHVFDNGKLAGNVGVGLRSLMSSFNHVFGAYCYYDVRQDNHHLTPQQVSPGIELLGKRMEYRINGYLPVGTTKSHKYDFKFDEFDGHHIILKGKQKFGMKGVDAEIGAHLTQSTSFDAYLGVGPYYFTSPHASAWGGKARLLGRYKQYVSLEASYSYDHLFGNIFQGTVAFNIPFGNKIRRKSKHCSSQTNLALSRAAFSPYRFEIPVVKKVSRKEPAINPTTGLPWQVWFVNNTSSSNGTFKSPFPTLAQAEVASAPNDMIYVFPGDGTSTGMDLGIVLKDGQKLFGSGIAHQIATTKGKIKIPAFSKNYPLIINNLGNVVSLANSNEVSGLNIFLVTDSTGVYSGTGISGAVIANNFISANPISATNGISIVGSGNISIMRNDITANANGIVVSLIDSAKVDVSENLAKRGFDAIAVTNVFNVPGVEAKISSNSVSGFLSNGIFCQNLSLTNISNNTILNGGGGVSASIFTLGTNFSHHRIEGNTIFTSSASPTNGIIVQNNQPGTHFSADILRNKVTTGPAIGSSGILVKVNTANSDICTGVSQNTVTQQTPGTPSFEFAADPTSVINIDDFSGNIGPGVAVIGNVNLVPPGTCD